jgi:DNA-binding NarL/FixJ family response regulator
MKKTKIFIADDHQLIIDGIEAIVNKVPEFELIGSAQDGKEAFQQILKLLPDLAILDIMMPGMDGIELCGKLKSEAPWIKVMIVSMEIDFGIIKSLLDLGADGYVLKDAGKQELLKALRSIAQGDKYFSSEVKDVFFDKPFDLQTTKNIILTSREKEVLELLSHGQSAKIIADNLCIGQSTVETHRKHLLSKLNVKNTAEMIRFAMENKLIE